MFDHDIGDGFDDSDKDNNNDGLIVIINSNFDGNNSSDSNSSNNDDYNDKAILMQVQKQSQFINLPPEIIHFILTHLDIPDLLSTSRTSHMLRKLSLDPLLHFQRRRLAQWTLSHRLSHRPSRAAISPPNAWICLNKTHVLSRSISRSLVKIRLGHSLERRPGMEYLVERAILPRASACCFHHHHHHHHRRFRFLSTSKLSSSSSPWSPSPLPLCSVDDCCSTPYHHHHRHHDPHFVGQDDTSINRGVTGFYYIAPAIVTRQEQVKKSILRDRLGRKLSRRPDVKRLVEMGIIPAECVSIDSTGRRRWDTADDNGGTIVAPGLVAMRRKVIKENLKDGLRAWVERRGWPEQKRRQGEWEDQGNDVRSVKALVRRLSARITTDLEQQWSSNSDYGHRNSGGGCDFPNLDRRTLNKKRTRVRWGREVEERREKEERRRAVLGLDTLLLMDPSQPTRAHVLGLRMFWEGVIKAAAG